jgi:hypothetical protein
MWCNGGNRFWALECWTRWFNRSAGTLINADESQYASDIETGPLSGTRQIWI